MRTSNLYKMIKLFARDKSGNLVIVFGFAVTVLMLGVGLSVNYIQLSTARANLKAAVDSAVSSTARDITTGVIKIKDAPAMIRAFVDANTDTAFLGNSKITINKINIDQKAKTVQVLASADVDMVIPVFGTTNAKIVSVGSKSKYSDKRVEIAMMLDVTGSMRGRKLKSLQTAAKAGISAFISDGSTNNGRVRISLVPYAGAVNAGALADKVVFVETQATSGPAPRIGTPTKVKTRPDNCATERKGSLIFSDAGPDAGMINRDYRVGSCPSAALMPLTGDAKALEARINSFQARGGTAGHIGIQWSWYMLSERWARFLPAASRPAKKNSKNIDKYAILMTDGIFNVNYVNERGEKTTRGGGGTSSQLAERLCEKMKSDGIEIFTIGFGLRQNGPKSMMRKCASPDKNSTKHYFEAADGTELKDAFLAIAANIERLTLVE